MRQIREVIVRTNYPNTISGDNRLVARLQGADVVKIVDMQTHVVLSTENPAVLLEYVKNIRIKNGKVKILVIPYTPGNTYRPPTPKSKVVLRKARG